MHRRSFLRNAGLAAGAGIFFRPDALASFLPPFEFNLRMLRNNVGIFTERGGTIGFLLHEEGNIVIDSQFPDTAAHLIDAVRKKNSGPITHLLNTHHHGDHTGGNIAFKGIAQRVVAHANSLANQQAVAEKSKTADKQLFPDTTFTNKWKLKAKGEKIRGYYYGAGHTNGDAVYHFQHANVMHLGDLMFNKRHPFVDRTAGANIGSWIKVLDRIMKEADKETLLVFGHSLNPGEETGTVEDVKKFQDYLGKVLSFAEAEVKKGVTKEAFIRNTAIPGVTEWTGQGIDRPLTAAYEEVTARQE